MIFHSTPFSFHYRLSISSFSHVIFLLSSVVFLIVLAIYLSLPPTSFTVKRKLVVITNGSLVFLSRNLSKRRLVVSSPTSMTSRRGNVSLISIRLDFD